MVYGIHNTYLLRLRTSSSAHHVCMVTAHAAKVIIVNSTYAIGAWEISKIANAYMVSTAVHTAVHMAGGWSYMGQIRGNEAPT